MTKALLHNDPQFIKLFEDPRFIGAVIYLRKNIDPQLSAAQGADQLIHRAGKIEGWLECLNAFERLSEPPKPETPETQKKPPYAH